MRKMIVGVARAKQQMFHEMAQSNWLRIWIPLAMCLVLILPNHATAGAFGLGYSGGKTFISYHVSSRLRAFVPLTMKNIIVDYRLFDKGLGNFGGMGLKAYFGLGTQVSLDGKDKKAKDDDFLGGFGMAIRLAIGVETRLSRFPVTIYMEMNPDVDIENVGDIKWKKFYFGFIYRF